MRSHKRKALSYSRPDLQKLVKRDSNIACRKGRANKIGGDRVRKKTKGPRRSEGLRIKPGDVLLSHTLARAVPSGLRSLTAVFGMGTGGSSSLGSPRNWRHPRAEVALWTEY